MIGSDCKKHKEGLIFFLSVALGAKLHHVARPSAVMSYLEVEADYKDLLDECERSSPDDAERQEEVSWSSPQRTISIWLCSPSIYHFALALLHSFVFLFIILRYIPDQKLGPNLIYCKFQLPSNKRSA